MSKSVEFKGATTLSHLRNGLVKTIGLDFARSHMMRRDCDELHPVVQIQAVNSRGRSATGYIEIPNDPIILQQIAERFSQLADEARGVDWNLECQIMVAVIDWQLAEQSLTREKMIDILDELVYQSVGDETASFINNQGIEEQVSTILRGGLKHPLIDKIGDEGIFSTDEIETYMDARSQMLRESRLVTRGM